MDKTVNRRTRLGILSIIMGIGVSVLSALESRIEWIASLCGILGNGCRDMVPYTLLGIPVPYWGIGFFLLLTGLHFIRRSWLFSVVMAGVGVEMALIHIMVSAKTICLLCAVNALIMLVLFITLFDRKRVYEMATAILLMFVVTEFSISGGFASEHPQVDPDTVLVSVADRTITLGEMNKSLAADLHRIEQSIYYMKASFLEERINQILLEIEASEQGVSSEYLESSVVSEVPEPHHARIDYYYVTGKYKTMGNMEGDEPAIKMQIRDYLYNQDVQKKKIIFRQLLQSKYPITLNLPPPELLMTDIPLEGSPSMGPTNAPVTVVEFSDYVCAYCRKHHSAVDQVKKMYEGRIRWVFKDYPLKMHADAKGLALAARCAGRQGKFWEFYEFLFAREKPRAEDVSMYAKELGLDIAQFNQCMDDPDLARELEADIAEAKNAGITATPSFLVNGKLHSGVPPMEKFCSMIDDALEEAGHD